MKTVTQHISGATPKVLKRGGDRRETMMTKQIELDRPPPPEKMFMTYILQAEANFYNIFFN